MNKNIIKRLLLVIALSTFISACHTVPYRLKEHHPDKHPSCTMQDQAGMTYVRYGKHACNEAMHACQLSQNSHPNTGRGCTAL